MKWRLHDNVREYIYNHLVVLEDKHYKELSEELGMADSVIRELKMEEQGVREGTLIIQRGVSDVRIVDVQELLDKTFNYAVESDKRRKAVSMANQRVVAENKRLEKMGMSYKTAADIAREDAEYEVAKPSRAIQVPVKEKIVSVIEPVKVIREEVKVVPEEKLTPEDASSDEEIKIVNEEAIVLEDDSEVASVAVKGDTSSENAEMARLYSEEYWTMSQLQEKFGYGVPKVRDILIAQGIEIRPRAVLLSKEKKDELMARLENESDKPIEYFVKLYQLSAATIESYLATLRGERNRIGNKSKAAFKRMCKILKINPSLSFIEAAEQAEISQNVLGRIFDMLEAEGFNSLGVKPAVVETVAPIEQAVEQPVKESGPSDTVLTVPAIPQPGAAYGCCEIWKQRALVAEKELEELKIKQRKLIAAHAEFISATLV